MVKKSKILIIDDEPVFTDACRRTFMSRDFKVMSAVSQATAKEMIREEPDIVVLGTLAPAGQAFALHKWFKQHPRYKDIPLLVIDSKWQERQIRGWRRFEGMQLEADDYVVKPVEPSELVPRIQYLLERSTKRIKVLDIDDHNMVRSGICAVLALQKDLELAGEAADGKDAVEKALLLAPDVALMDIVMPVMNGLEATRQISRECPKTRVLILTQYDEEENMLVARKAGALGFVPKRAASTDLIAGIRAVNAGKYFPATFGQESKN